MCYWTWRRADQCAKAMWCCFSMACFLSAAGCATQSQIESTLERNVRMIVGQELLRDVLAEIADEARISIVIDPKLDAIADLAVTYISTQNPERRVPLAGALDIITMQVYTSYGVSAAWRIEDDRILVYFAGNDEEYKTLRKRD